MASHPAPLHAGMFRIRAVGRHHNSYKHRFHRMQASRNPLDYMRQHSKNHPRKCSSRNQNSRRTHRRVRGLEHIGPHRNGRHYRIHRQRHSLCCNWARFGPLRRSTLQQGRHRIRQKRNHRILSRHQRPPSRRCFRRTERPFVCLGTWLDHRSWVLSHSWRGSRWATQQLSPDLTATSHPLAASRSQQCMGSHHRNQGFVLLGKRRWHRHHPL